MISLKILLKKNNIPLNQIDTDASNGIINKADIFFENPRELKK